MQARVGSEPKHACGHSQNDEHNGSAVGYVVDNRNWEVLEGVQQRGGGLVDGGVEGLGLVFAAPNGKAAACTRDSLT